MPNLLNVSNKKHLQGILHLTLVHFYDLVWKDSGVITLLADRAVAIRLVCFLSLYKIFLSVQV